MYSKIPKIKFSHFNFLFYRDEVHHIDTILIAKVRKYKFNIIFRLHRSVYAFNNVLIYNNIRDCLNYIEYMDGLLNATLYINYYICEYN